MLTWSDCDGESISDPEFDFTRVGDHFDRLAVTGLVDCLRCEGLEARADFAGREIPGGSDELDPKGHASLSAVAEFEDRASGKRTVVHEVEDSHLVEEESDLKLGRTVHSESLVVRSVRRVGQGRHEPRFLDFDFLEDVLRDFDDVPQVLEDALPSEGDSLRDKLVHPKQEQLSRLGLTTSCLWIEDKSIITRFGRNKHVLDGRMNE
jgi:hypothetical protein